MLDRLKSLIKNKHVKLRACVVILPLLLAGSHGLAAEKVVPVKKGEVIPFDGMLYPTENAIRVSVKAERCDFLLSEAEAEKYDLIENEKLYCDQKLDLDRKAAKQRERVLEDRPIPLWAIAVAYLSGVATIVFGAWVTGEISK